MSQGRAFKITKDSKDLFLAGNSKDTIPGPGYYYDDKGMSSVKVKGKSRNERVGFASTTMRSLIMKE